MHQPNHYIMAHCGVHELPWATMLQQGRHMVRAGMEHRQWVTTTLRRFPRSSSAHRSADRPPRDPPPPPRPLLRSARLRSLSFSRAGAWAAGAILPSRPPCPITPPRAGFCSPSTECVDWGHACVHMLCNLLYPGWLAGCNPLRGIEQKQRAAQIKMAAPFAHHPHPAPGMPRVRAGRWCYIWWAGPVPGSLLASCPRQRSCVRALRCGKRWRHRRGMTRMHIECQPITT